MGFSVRAIPRRVRWGTPSRLFRGALIASAFLIFAWPVALDSGLVPSMGSIGDCFDNAVIESFWARMQVELLDRQRWSTRVELANAIFEYLEIFHNRKRRHSALGMRTPIEFETMHTYPSEVA